MEILFRNETKTSQVNIEKIEKYTRPYMKYIVKSIKLSICIFIILYSLILLLLNRKIITIVYILFAMWGITDTLSKKPKRVKAQVITYEFYTPYFVMKTPENTIKIGYDQIKKVEEDEINYYIIFYTKCGICLDKNSFSIGDKNGIKQFIQEKIDANC